MIFFYEVSLIMQYIANHYVDHSNAITILYDCKYKSVELGLPLLESLDGEGTSTLCGLNENKTVVSLVLQADLFQVRMPI